MDAWCMARMEIEFTRNQYTIKPHIPGENMTKSLEGKLS